MRRAGRIDSNQNEIVEGLRARGFLVHITSNLGNGFPDIMVGSVGRLFLFEIKTSAKEKLKPKEVDFLERWNSYNAFRVNSLEDCLTRLSIYS